ncbi:NADH-quinone oxidoreductase subunit G [Nakamurella endophytica]|uniref:NADH-quinone oxidoreductase n=1 Tax=Nakamurella endophytica TaxID=1748367 RepID=A0A917SXP3_9ACTN|nr:NADH-quinone oxidoreductase subunit G [Nakamurella endophytica]GGM03746.1 hypothetical protein GCM10011594_24950 [Nakamurella endophytica]
MTQVATPPAAGGTGDGEDRPVPPGHVRLTIDGITVDAPKGELVIRAAERIGIAIPRFCDHPLLDPVGACRQCLVEVEMGGRPMPKPQASCTQTVGDGMVVRTQVTSPVAEKAQRSNLEFLLLNHPLDCPICDKGGECPLQNQTLANGSATSRMHEAKRVFTKPVPVSTEILLDRERCVLCQRCTRFSDQIAGDRFIDLLERGSSQQIGINSDEPFQSYFSGNTIQICPVGALTSTAYRFRSRPFDLVSTGTVCEHCASGCALRTDHRTGVVMRRLAAPDPEVNEEWNCDKGRFGFGYLHEGDRLARPLVRDADGQLQPASWTDAMTAAAQGLARARDDGGVGVLTGGRLTVTDAYAYAKFARVALRTNDVDFRARRHSAEEASFLADRVAGVTPSTGGPTYADLEAAPAVLLVALEPEDESPILFLRLRKAARRGVPVFTVGAVESRGSRKLSATLLPALPGAEADLLADLTADARPVVAGAAAADRNRAGQLLRASGAVVLVGERAAETPGLLTAVGRLADATGARLAWVPRRAGERGALEAGALPGLLPGGRPVTDPAARAHVEQAWGVELPARPGRDTAAMIASVLARAERDERALGLVGPAPSPDLPRPAESPAADDRPAGHGAVGLVERVVETVAGSVSGAVHHLRDLVTGEHEDAAVAPGPQAPAEPGLAGLLLGGVELDDLPDPAAALAAVAATGFVVSLEIRASAVTALADVVLPVAAVTQKSGAFLDWEGRHRPFDAALPTPGVLDDGRVLDTLGVEMDVDLYTQTPVAARADMARAVPPAPAGGTSPGTAPGPADARRGPAGTAPRDGQGFVLVSWRTALDGGRLLDGEPHLAGTARPDVVRLSPRAAELLGVGDGAPVQVHGPSGGTVTLPLQVTAMVDEAVWLPGRIRATPLVALLGAGSGDRVRVRPAAGGEGL